MRPIKYVSFYHVVYIDGSNRQSFNVTNKQFAGFEVDWFPELGYMRFMHRAKKIVKYVGVTNISEWEPMDLELDLEESPEATTEPKRRGRPPKDDGRHLSATSLT